MSMKNVSIHTNYGIERVMIRATKAQKSLVDELRSNKDLYIRNENGDYKLYCADTLVRLVNAKTIDKLLSQEVLIYVDPKSNKIALSTEAK